MEKKNLVRMAIDAYNGTPLGDYSIDETQAILYKAVFGEDANKDTDIYRLQRAGKIDFDLIEAIITEATKEKIQNDHPLLQLIDWHYLDEGDGIEFQINRPDTDKFIVSQIAQGTQGLRRQRLYGGDTITVAPKLHGVKIYEELRRILAGRVDFNYMIQVAIDSFAQARIDDAFQAVKGSFEAIVTAANSKYYKTGSFSESDLVDIIDMVEAKTGMKASIFGTKKAVRKITGVKGANADSALERLYNFGFYDKFYTTPIFVMPDALDASDNFILSGTNTDLYIVAGEDKWMKGVEEGKTLIIPGNPTDNSDLSQEWFMSQSFGVAAAMSPYCGVYRVS